ncbi:MAG: large conductance mechanosensitive channel protein MscL [Acidiphilium sp.]
MSQSLKRPGWIDEFKAFLVRGNVVDLAVAVVVGAAFTGIVSSLVANIINPIIGLATGGVDFSNHFITLKGNVAPTLAAAKKNGAVTLNYGLFINAVINFVIVAFVIFWVVKMVQKIYSKPPPPAAVPAPSPTEQLLAEIRDLLKIQHQP